MRVASFNVNGIRARLGILTDWLQATDMDVVCLQETKVQDKDFPASPLEEAGYQAAFIGQKSYNGVAILSKEPLEDVATGFADGAFPEDARLIWGTLGGVRIVNTYVPQGQDITSEKFAYKLDWLRRLRDEFSSLLSPDEMVLWVGDLNIARDDRDVYAPDEFRGQVCFHPDEQALLDEILGWGMEDVFRKHVEDDEEYSFFDYRIPNGLKRNHGWRVDHIMATAPLAAVSETSWIDRDPRGLEKPSDHTPICAEFAV